MDGGKDEPQKTGHVNVIPTRRKPPGGTFKRGTEDGYNGEPMIALVPGRGEEEAGVPWVAGGGINLGLRGSRGDRPHAAK